MGIFEITEKYQDKKLYNINEVVDNFSEYFDMSLEEMINYFSNYSITTKEEFLSGINLLNNECVYLKEIVNNKMVEYDYYCKVLEILSSKALTYLMMIKYLCNSKEKNGEYEQILEEAQIYHYSSVVIGEGVNKFLVVLFHLLNKFSNTLEVINDDNFTLNKMSMGFVNYDNDEIYPSENLVIKDNYYGDKTSFYVKRKVR